MIGFESRNLATLRSSQATSILPRKPFWRKGKIAAGKVTRQESAKKYLRLSGQFGQVEIVLGGTAALHALSGVGGGNFFRRRTAASFFLLLLVIMLLLDCRLKTNAQLR